MSQLPFADRLPFSGPAWGALYPEPPHFYRNTSNLFMSYATNAEETRRLLPDGVSLLSDEARVIVWICDSPFGTFGPHQGAYAFIEVEFEGRPFLYEAFLWVSSESALAAGRELWGDSKKLADISLRLEREEVVAEVSRTDAQPILRLRMRVEAWGEVAELPSYPGLCLKMIPSAASPRSWEVLQLVADEMDIRPVIASDGRAEVFAGTGTIALTPDVALDPVGLLTPIGPVRAHFARLHLELGMGAIVRDYLS
jgi:acetoacetate decarboxylase